MLALTVVGKSPILGIIALTLVTAGILSWVATFWTLPTAFLSGTAAAAGIAWINSVGNLGGHFGPDMIGRIRTATGSSESAFLVLAALGFVGAMIVLKLPRTEKR
jgi:nitrate/nitrite transporter NarK